MSRTRRTPTHAQIIAVRQRPTPECLDLTVVLSELGSTLRRLATDWETVFVHREFAATRPPGVARA